MNDLMIGGIVLREGEDPRKVRCLATGLDEGERLDRCARCRTIYTRTALWQEPLCINCSSTRVSTGELAREKNRDYGRKHNQIYRQLKKEKQNVKWRK